MYMQMDETILWVPAIDVLNKTSMVPANQCRQ